MEKRTEIVKPARAGSVESNDCLVIISPADELSIEISSEVNAQYGDQLKLVVEETLKELGVEKANVKLEDKGALDFTIKARIEACVLRGAK